MKAKVPNARCPSRLRNTLECTLEFATLVTGLAGFLCLLTFPPAAQAANDLTSNNNVGHTNGITADGAAKFTSVNSQSFTRASDSRLQGEATELTFSAWVKLDSLKPAVVIVSKDDSATTAGSEYYLGYYQSYGGFVFQVETSVTTRYVIGSCPFSAQRNA